MERAFFALYRVALRPGKAQQAAATEPSLSIANSSITPSHSSSSPAPGKSPLPAEADHNAQASDNSNRFRSFVRSLGGSRSATNTPVLPSMEMENQANELVQQEKTAQDLLMRQHSAQQRQPSIDLSLEALSTSQDAVRCESQLRRYMLHKTRNAVSLMKREKPANSEISPNDVGQLQKFVLAEQSSVGLVPMHAAETQDLKNVNKSDRTVMRGSSGSNASGALYIAYHAVVDVSDAISAAKAARRRSFHERRNSASASSADPDQHIFLVCFVYRVASVGLSNSGQRTASSLTTDEADGFGLFATDLDVFVSSVVAPALRQSVASGSPPAENEELLSFLGSWFGTCIGYISRVVSMLCDTSTTTATLATVLHASHRRVNIVVRSKFQTVFVRDLKRFVNAITDRGGERITLEIINDSNLQGLDKIHEPTADDDSLVLDVDECYNIRIISSTTTSAQCVLWANELHELQHDPFAVRSAMAGHRSTVSSQFNMLKRLLDRARFDHYALRELVDCIRDRADVGDRGSSIVVHQLRGAVKAIDAEDPSREAHEVLECALEHLHLLPRTSVV